MNLKKILTINIFIIFVLTFISHFIYDIFPNNLSATFFPVNESIFEHMKMLYTTFLIDSIVLYFILKKENIQYNNFLIAIFISSIISITSFLIIWLPIYYHIGENLIITLLILFLSIFLSQIIGYCILTTSSNKILNFVTLILIIIFIIIFAYFTYNPLFNDFFLDPISEKYGLNHYLIK